MYVFIVNPIAGNGKGLRIYEEIITNAHFSDQNYEVYFTKYKGHAEKIVKKLLINHPEKKDKHWVVFGGDGTFHEVVNGMGQYSLRLSYIRGGSGNDFARGANFSFHKKKLIASVFQEQASKEYYLGSYNKRRFINCVGFGFDAIVAKATNESVLKNRLNKWKLGKITYVIQLVKQLFTYKPIDIEVTVDKKVYDFSNCFLLTINNHPYFGGGMKINPYASNNKDVYHCIVIHDIPKWKVFFLFGTVFIGKYTNFKEITFLKGKTFTIKSKKPVVFQADGETSETTDCVITNERLPIQLIGSQAN